MFRVSVCYGQPDDPDAFDAYYADIHIPLARRIPGLRELSVGKCRSISPGEPAPHYMVAHLVFDTAEDLQAALTSPEMATASADVANFATGGVTVYSTEETQQL